MYTRVRYLAGVGEVGGSPLNVVVCQERIVHHRLVLAKLIEAEAHRRAIVAAVEHSCEKIKDKIQTRPNQTKKQSDKATLVLHTYIHTSWRGTRLFM